VNFSRLAFIVAEILVFPNFVLAAQPAYEPSTTLNASQILPRELLAGPNHRVEERVYNDGYINRYTVLSKFGD
jgi:hypothetical protein